jgi:hypothetical protein
MEQTQAPSFPRSLVLRYSEKKFTNWGNSTAYITYALPQTNTVAPTMLHLAPHHFSATSWSS